MLKGLNKGSIGGTAVGMLALGLFTASFGALFVGPGIAGALDDNPRVAPARAVTQEPQSESVRTAAQLDTPAVFDPAGPPEPKTPQPPVSLPDTGPELPDSPSNSLASAAPSLVAAEPAKPLEVTPRSEAAVPVKPEPAPVAEPEAPRPAAAVPTPEAPPPETAETADAPRTATYRVRVGRYETREAAEEARRALRRAGTGGLILRVGESYQVQVGAYRTRPGADQLAERLRAHNFPVEVYDSPRRGSASDDNSETPR